MSRSAWVRDPAGGSLAGAASAARVALGAVAAALLAGCLQGQPSAAASPVPEAATGLQGPTQAVLAPRAMVAAANPLASRAGLQMLQAGGSAIDAAVAVQMVLTLVEPQSSGIGGGAFLMHWDGRTLQALDGRETAPAAADERLFLQASGQPMAFMQAAVGGRAVGVPGVVRMLEAAHRQHGRLPWAQLFEPAIALADEGFALSPRLHALLQGEQALRQDAQARGLFYTEQGPPHPVGHKLRNPALAQVLRAIAARGSEALHQGPIAADLVARVRAHPHNPGVMTTADLAGYRVAVREPMCTAWRASLRVCGFPPPSSGHLTIMQILGLLAHAQASAGARDPLYPPDKPLGVEGVHRYTEAARLAYADRAQYIADPDFVAPPGGSWSSLLAPAYLRERAQLIGPRSMGTAAPGVPPALAQVAKAALGDAAAAWPYAPMPEQPEYGTSHVSIVDAHGSALALTTTIEAAFGSRVMSDGGTGLVGGFLLNNQLTDFSLAPADAQGRPIANRVQPGKRPRSSMSPTLVFDARDGRLLMSLGSPGGAAIIHFTAKTLLGTFETGLSPQQAIALPNFGSQNGPTQLERDRFDAAFAAALQAKGHTVQAVDLTSGLQAILRTPQGWLGGADPRREGVVLGY
jgi:gamma-glutamyltranspeptidase / glutathione hydrolase